MYRLSFKLFFLIGILLLSNQCTVDAQSIKNPTYRLMLKMMYKQTVDLMSVSDLAKKVKQKESLILLDAREKKEFETSHIKDAIWIGYEDFTKKRVAELPKDQTVIVYCSVGARSEQIGEQLKNLGFEEVYNLYGGLFEWLNQGYAVENKDGNVTKDIHAYSKLWGVWVDQEAGDKVYD